MDPVHGQNHHSVRPSDRHGSRLRPREIMRQGGGGGVTHIRDGEFRGCVREAAAAAAGAGDTIRVFSDLIRGQSAKQKHPDAVRGLGCGDDGCAADHGIAKSKSGPAVLVRGFQRHLCDRVCRAGDVE